MRIDRLLSQFLFGSRKEVKQMVYAKEVIVNDKIVLSSDYQVNPNHDIIQVRGETLYYKEHMVIMMNKRIGTVSANVDELHPTVFSELQSPYHRFTLHVAGRLDLDTEGLLLLTNDGDLLHRIISPKHQIYKTYLVMTQQPIERLALLEEGINIKDGRGYDFTTLPARTKQINEQTCLIQIAEGKFHQVKRMFEAIGLEVVSLKRIQIGSLKLDETLAPGEYRECTKAEIEMLFQDDFYEF